MLTYLKISWRFRLVCKDIYIPDLLPHKHTQTKFCVQKSACRNVSFPRCWWNTSQCKMTLQINVNILCVCLEMGQRPCTGQIPCTGLCAAFQSHSCRGNILWCKRQNKKSALLISVQSLLLRDLHSPQLFITGFHKQNIYQKIPHCTIHALLSIHFCILSMYNREIILKFHICSLNINSYKLDVYSTEVDF